MTAQKSVTTELPPAFPELFTGDCPEREIFDQITNRWATLILSALMEGPTRFSALKSKLGGISQKMLSQNLKALARDGLIERSVEPTNPPQVSYALTELGAELTTPLVGLVRWIGAHTNQILELQSKHDATPP
jgi:DNA-binding HxlR family transcriptional regulator